MHRYVGSSYRIITRVAFLFFALTLGFLFWYLPTLLNLDLLRPRVTGELESTFHCRALVGGITAAVCPHPGLIIAPVVLMENTNTPVVLASVRAVRMNLSVRPLLKRQLEFESIRFNRPRFIAHRIREPSGLSRWIMLTLPNAPSSKEKLGIDEWQVRNGRLEIWDQTRKPTAKWVSDELSGTFRVREQIGAIAGKVPRLGSDATLDLHYRANDPFPVQARVIDMDFGALQSHLPTPILKLEGKTDLIVESRFQPETEIRARIDQPSGAGQIKAVIRHETSGNWRWSVVGNHTHLIGTSFDVPEWSARDDHAGLAVYVRGITADGGMADVGLTEPPASDESTLNVYTSSVTIRQILEIFKVASKTPVQADASFNPYGYVAW